jgi:hypothetical protein
MTIKNDFLAQLRVIMIIDLLLICLGGIPVYWLLGTSSFVSIVIALALTTVYSLIGAFYITKYFNAPFDEFMSKIFGAVFLRLAGLAVSIFLILKFTSFPEITFTVCVFISYISKSVQEIIFINKKSAKSQNPG